MLLAGADRATLYGLILRGPRDRARARRAPTLGRVSRPLRDVPARRRPPAPGPGGGPGRHRRGRLPGPGRRRRTARRSPTTSPSWCGPPARPATPRAVAALGDGPARLGRRDRRPARRSGTLAARAARRSTSPGCRCWSARSLAGTTPVVVPEPGPFRAPAFVAAAAALGDRRRGTPRWCRRSSSASSTTPPATERPAHVRRGAASAAPRPRRTCSRAPGPRASAVVTTYGMSETCGGCVYDGVPLDGVARRARRRRPHPAGRPRARRRLPRTADLDASRSCRLDGRRWLRTVRPRAVDDGGSPCSAAPTTCWSPAAPRSRPRPSRPVLASCPASARSSSSGVPDDGVGAGRRRRRRPPRRRTAPTLAQARARRHRPPRRGPRPAPPRGHGLAPGARAGQDRPSGAARSSPAPARSGTSTERNAT